MYPNHPQTHITARRKFCRVSRSLRKYHIKGLELAKFIPDSTTILDGHGKFHPLWPPILYQGHAYVINIAGVSWVISSSPYTIIWWQLPGETTNHIYIMNTTTTRNFLLLCVILHFNSTVIYKNITANSWLIQCWFCMSEIINCSVIRMNTYCYTWGCNQSCNYFTINTRAGHWSSSLVQKSLNGNHYNGMLNAAWHSLKPSCLKCSENQK